MTAWGWEYKRVLNAERQKGMVMGDENVLKLYSDGGCTIL